MTSVRIDPLNDDHGDQFPGAVPTPLAASRKHEAEQRLVRMHAAYVQKVNSVVEAGDEDLAHELADTFARETGGVSAERTRRAAGRRTPTRSSSGRPQGQADTRLGRMGRFTRSSLDRLDRYTLDVFNPGAPYRSKDDRSA